MGRVCRRFLTAARLSAKDVVRSAVTVALSARTSASGPVVDAGCLISNADVVFARAGQFQVDRGSRCLCLPESQSTQPIRTV